MHWKFELNLFLVKLIWNSSSDSRVPEGNEPGIRIQEHPGENKLGIQIRLKFEGVWGT